MMLFRLFLIGFLIALVAYTGVVIANHGWNLMPIFFGDIVAMNWPGQFNFDFSGFLLLSAIWTVWRHHFSPVGLALGVVAVFGGMLYLSIYLLTVSFLAKGDASTVLLGPKRARAGVAAG